MHARQTANVDYPHKRLRVETAPKFINASQIRNALHQDDPETLIETLTSLRNQLTVKPQEAPVSPQDERLSLVKQCTESMPGAHDLFSIWDKANPRQSSLIALVISLLSAVLGLLSVHYNNHALGQPIMKTLLTASRLRHLNSFLGGSNNELIIVTLKLFNVMSSFAGGRDRKAVLEGFGWEIKSLPKLLNMRRKTHGEKDLIDPLLRPDIRTLYVLLLLSFVDADSPSQTKSLFLEQHREAFLAIFKGLVHDHYSLARKILEVCWAGVWSDSKLKRTLKVGLFNETALAHLIKLYDRVLSEDGDEDHIPANLVHHFLLAICTRPGTGICFKDRGWYPREANPEDIAPKEEEEEGKRKSGKIHNKILANILKTLKVNEDSRQQELVTKILSACPELVSGYWSAVALTLEPRLSSKWITNIAVFGNIISLPPPSSSFLLMNTQLYQPSPPPLSTIMENTVPFVNTKSNFSKGLQSSSGLVQHCTALALCKCLDKYKTVREQFHKVASALEEDEEEGQWHKRCRELDREVRRRVPDFQVLVAFSQQKHSDPKVQANHTKVALLAESAQRLLWLYHRCLPSVVAEVRFDVGKLLQTFSQEAQAGIEDVEDESPDAPARLYRVQQLHVLSLLKDSDQFVWSGRIASLSQTPFHILLTALSSATIPAIRTAIAGVLHHILSQCILFQEDPNEPELWLKVLPRKRLVPVHASASLFEGETDGIISFIDECVQRCLKTPYRYVEALHTLGNTSSATAGPSEKLDMYPSPLLMALIEQLDAKINIRSLAPSHVIGIASFIRKLLFNLSSKTSDLRLLHLYALKVDETLRAERLSEEPTAFAAVVRREVDILHASLSFSPVVVPTTSSNLDVQRHLDEVEQMPIPGTKELRIGRPLELIDWMRSSPHPLTTADLKRLFALILACEQSLLPLIIENLVPGQTDPWQALDLISKFSDLRPHLDFQYLDLNAANGQILDEMCQTILSDSIFTHPPKLVDVMRGVYLIMHRVSASRQRGQFLRSYVSVLARILKASGAVLSSADVTTLKEMLFVHPNILKDVMMSPSSPDVVDSIQYMLESCVDPISEHDRMLVSDISNYWFNTLITGLDNQAAASVSTACLWIKYLEPGHLFDLLDFLEKNTQNMPSVSVLQPINVVLESLCSITSINWEAELTLLERLPQLLSLRSIMQDSSLLDQVIATAIEASLPIGLNGCPARSALSNSVDFVNVVRRSEARWSRRNQSVKVELDIRSFLTQPAFSTSTIKTICGLIYRQSYSREVFIEWIQSPHCLQKSAEHILPIIHAFLDSSETSAKSSLSRGIWLPFIPIIVRTITDHDTPLDLQRQAQLCLTDIVSTSGSDVSATLNVLEKEFQSLPEKQLSPEILFTGVNLAVMLGSQANPILSILVDRGMQLCIDQFAEAYETTESTKLAEALISLLQRAAISKAHFVETLLTVIIQNRFSDMTSLRLAASCLSTCQLKPAIVNRHLQSIIQHPHFFKVCSSTSPELSKVRDVLIELLHRLFNLHPGNTCQITHIEPLIKVYRGTLSNSDLRILSIFQLFESQRKLSVTPLLSRWSSVTNNSSHTSLEAVQSLDPILLLRTCLNFPHWRRLEDQSNTSVDVQEAILYDPVFLMLLFSHMLSDQPPTSAFGWIELFRTNIVSLFIRTLSSKDGQIRDLALCQMAALWKQTEVADLQERPHVMYILNLLKDLMPSPISGDFTPSISEFPRRLPTYTTLLLMHSLRAIFHPSNFIYPITARFLLQRPSLDVADVPMLYGLLYSSSDENWKKERAWIIKFLADGMVCSEDWRVLKRRHTWDLLASLFQCSDDVQDGPLRMAILEVLANLTCNAQATTSLILKSALLPWLEMQLLYSTTKAEGVEWIKILENIIVIVDANKVEASTNGEWRVIICRCLGYLLDEKNCVTATENLPHAVPVIWRLSSLPGPPLADLPSLLNLAVTCLEKLEGSIQVDGSTGFISESDQNVLPHRLHRSLTIHQRVSDIQHSAPLSQSLLFAVLLEMLWKASMSIDQTCEAWEKLTPRILLWRSIRFATGERKGMDVAEWARKEVVLNFRGD